ncbi:MAG: peptidase domain-containing ABC transporter [Bacteroidota bacterium]
MAKKFPFSHQLFQKDCGATCLLMIAKFYGKSHSIRKLRELAHTNRGGVNLVGLANAAEAIGFKTLSARTPFEKLKDHFPLPLIAYWKKRHFVVVYGFSKKHVLVADPAHGLIKYTFEEFMAGWLNHQNREEATGIVLVLEPSPEFYSTENEQLEKASWSFILSYLRPYRRYLWQLILGMIAGSLLMLILPFLTQSIVDVGINMNNPGFINVILIAQLVITLSQTSVGFIRSWILLHINTRLNLFIVSDFFKKLMNLPISFFDSKMTGDIMQRISDHKRIESFLTSNALNFLFSVFNLIVFSSVLIYYSLEIYMVFLVGSLIYVVWIIYFLKKRRDYDYKLFDHAALNQTSVIQLITGMQEIKLHNSERMKRWEYDRLQARLFLLSQEGLALNQYEGAGTVLINQSKNILLTYMTAMAVINGQITFGMMLSIQFIIGQVNAPISQLIEFIHSFQLAKISLERLDEIHNYPNEEDNPRAKVKHLPRERSICVKNLHFAYPGGDPVLQDVSLEIPQNKTTAIVGMSGSGKTTLIKMLLGFYKPNKGEIRVGNIRFENISVKQWREKCGSVLQDGFIFFDTIAKNIALGVEEIDWERLLYACEVANIQAFIDSLPLGFQTVIGMEGQGISQGQRQRMLIARAVYRNPEYIFFDEATNALDATNEREIMQKLNTFLEHKTVVIVAHRLSTVVHADNIVVLDKGRIIEAGTHAELVNLGGTYYALVREQLELGH